MEKLELKHLAPYLPYGLKMGSVSKNCTLQHGTINLRDGFLSIGHILTSDKYKPILRPLSDLTKEIEVDGKRFIPWEWFNENPTENHCEVYEEWFEHIDDNNDASWVAAPYELTAKLFEWHFDVFGLIDKGLAIDINTL